MRRDQDGELERLISRFLDDEANAGERRELNMRVDADPAARLLFDEYVDLDREAGRALRTAMNRPLHVRVGSPAWVRTWGAVALAAAAGLALMFGISVPAWQGRPGDGDVNQAGFFHNPSWSDVMEADPARFDRPRVQHRGRERELILIPSGRPGEFIVIELNRIRVRTTGIQQDF